MLLQIDVVDRWGSTPLLEALKTNHLDIADALVDNGASLPLNQFALVKSAAETDIAELELVCLKAGADPNSKDHDSRTALHAACAAGNLKAVKSLMKVGADVNFKDRCSPSRCFAQMHAKVAWKLLHVQHACGVQICFWRSSACKNIVALCMTQASKALCPIDTG
jgi:ankyrin repeat protein